MRRLGWIGRHDDYDTAVTDTALIDPDVLERVLSTALVGGGDMAEVFAEDAVDVERPARRPPGRGALLRPVAWRRDPGRRRRDDRLRPHGRPERGGAAGRGQGGGRGGPAGRQRGAHRGARPADAPTGGATARRPTRWTRRASSSLLTRADEAARAAGDAITQVQVGCGDSRRRILIANSDGLLAQDEQIRTRFNVSCVANGDTGMQTGYESLARTEGYEIFERHRVEDIAEMAAARALAKLSARPAPSGEVPIVLAGGSGGILFHEACGHGLEADHIVKDASVYTGQVGQLVASPLVTLVDDGTVLGEWGNFAVDDEGCLPARNVLIENGVLTDYMWDWLRARKEGRKSSGNGRRQSYQHLPMVRMTNTYLLAGTEDPDGDRGPDPFGRLREEARRRAGQYGDGRLRLRDHGGLPD